MTEAGPNRGYHGARERTARAIISRLRPFARARGTKGSCDDAEGSRYRGCRMSALDQWDFAVLNLALEFLGHHADVELANAQAQRNIRRQFAMSALRRQIASVRAKLLAMQVSS